VRTVTLLGVLTVAAYVVTIPLLHHLSLFPISEIWAFHWYFVTCSAWWKQPSSLTQVALAARLLPSHFLLASSICRPLALQAYIYARFSHCQSLHPEDGGSMDLWNVYIHPQHYAMSQPRRIWIFKNFRSHIKI